MQYLKLPSGCRIAIDAVSNEDFLEFTRHTKYKTYLESFDGDTWCNNDWISGPLFDDKQLPSVDCLKSDAVYLAKQDALAYIEWKGAGRLPTFDELSELYRILTPPAQGYPGCELFDSSESDGLGHCLHYISEEDAISFNQLKKEDLSYFERLASCIQKISLSNFPPAGFRIALD